MKNFYLSIFVLAIFSFNQTFAQSCPPIGVSDGTSLKFLYDAGTSLCEDRPDTVTVDTYTFVLVECGDTYSIYEITTEDTVGIDVFSADFGFGTCEYDNGSLSSETLSVDDASFLENSIRVFPNPVTGNSDLSILFGSNMDVKVSIYSVTGKLVLANAVSNGDRIKINTSTFSNGVYLLQINANNTTVTRKVIVMN